jgi:hypothetical protein
VLAAAVVLALAAYLALPAVLPFFRSRDGDAGGASEARPRPAGPPPPGAAQGPPGLASAEELARKQREARDRAAGWLRENSLRAVGDSLTAYVASHIDRDLDASEAFQVLLGPGLTRSSGAALLAGRAGELQVFELGPALARGVPPGCCHVQNYSAGEDLRRAAPRFRLADLQVQHADQLFPERPVTGSIGYRSLGRRPGEYALRLTFYFGKHRRGVLLPRPPLSEPDRGALAFSFPPLGGPHEVVPGPAVVFVEVVSQGPEGTVVESNAAAAAVYVMPPEAARPEKP